MENKNLRVCLTGKCIEDLKAMLSDLKSVPGTSASHSELVSWAIEKFYLSGYQDQKHNMIKHFTGFKKFLRDASKDTRSEEEIMADLSSIIKAKKRENKSENASEKDKSLT